MISTIMIIVGFCILMNVLIIPVTIFTVAGIICYDDCPRFIKITFILLGILFVIAMNLINIGISYKHYLFKLGGQ